MRRSTIAALLVVLTMVCSRGLLGQDRSRPFIVVSAMNNKTMGSGLADLSSFGIKSVPIIYDQQILSKGDERLLDPDKLHAFMAKVERGPIPTVIDIERWPPYPAHDPQRAKNVSKLLGVLEALRKERPDMQFGFYSLLPQRVYWPVVLPNDPRFRAQKQEWEATNEVNAKELAPHVDAIYASLYSFYPDESGWETYAIENLKAARQFGKPVYCFLWPQLEKAGPPQTAPYLEPRFWRLQLDTCHKYADGIVLWGWWDPDAPWWRETQSFLRAIKK